MIPLIIGYGILLFLVITFVAVGKFKPKEKQEDKYEYED